MGTAGGAEGRQSRKANHKRLFVLWLICVGCAWGGVVGAEGLLRATLLGAVVFPVLAGASFALALGLWVRARWAWWTALVLSVIGLARPAWDYWLATRGNDYAAMGGAAVALWIALFVVCYLLWRRTWFRVPRAEKPRLGSPLFIATFGPLLMLGICYALVLNVDDPAREFPGLALEQHSVPADENGYVIFQQMEDPRGSFSEEDDGYTLSDVPEKGTEEFYQWLAEAPRLLSEEQDTLKKVELILSRPHFVFTEPLGPAMLGGRCEKMRDLALLLSAKATFEFAEDRPDEAMATALDTVTMGVRYADAGGALMDFLVGQSVMFMGLDDVRGAASARAVDVASVRSALSRLPGEDRLRQALVRTAGVEFHFHQKMSLATKNLDFAELGPEFNSSEIVGVPYANLYADVVPIFKVNMTNNMVGKYFRELAFEKINAYSPRQPEGDGWRELAPGASLIDWARNPVGLILGGMTRGAFHTSLHETYFCLLAHLRATDVLLALRAYHLDHGTLPATLEALAPDYLPEVPTDPFSGHPFTYRPFGSPPVLLSLGADLERDGERNVERWELDLQIPLNFAAVQE